MSEAAGNGAAEVPEIHPDELAARLERDEPLLLVDVREPFERAIADLPERGQLRIPVAELLQRLGEIDPESDAVVYCRSGARSAWAVQQLLDNGFVRVGNLKGGVLGWRATVDPSLRAY